MSQLVYSKEFDFIPKLQLSKARRAVNYTLGDYSTNTLPKRFRDKNCNYKYLKNEFCWKENKLYNLDTKSFEIRNPRTVGKPKYWIINGQDLYNGKFERLARAGLIQKLHEYFYSLIPDCPKFNLQNKERYWIKFTWYLIEDKVYPDTSNLWIYGKVFNDVFVKTLKIVEDDSPKYHKKDEYDTEYKNKEGFKIEIWKV